MTRVLAPLYVDMSKPPTPATRTAWLPSAGYDYMRATKHRHVKTVERSFLLPKADPTEPDKWEDVWVHIFACVDTDAERVWGYEVKMGPAVPLN